MSLTNQISGWVNNLWNDLFRVNPVSITYAPGESRLINNTPPVYADPKAETFIKQGFAGNASVYTIVKKASKKFGHINRGVYEITDQKAYKRYNNLCKAGLSTKASLQEALRLRTKAFKAYEAGAEVKNALSELLDRPNKWQGQDSFFELASVFYMVTGEAFIWLNRGDVDEQLDDSAVMKLPVLEMYVLPSPLIEIIPDQDDPWDIKGYWFDIYGSKGSRKFIRKCDMIQWKMVNPVFDGGQSRQHLRGLSPLRPGNKIVTQDSDSTDAAVAMYQNGGAKAVIFDKNIRTLTTVQETAQREVLDNKVNSKGQKAAVAAMQGDWGMLDLGLSSVDMELLEGGEKAFVKLCNLLDVPPAMFITDQTYENKAAAVKDWLTNSVIPAACSLRDEMNRVLLPAFKMGKGMMIDNDISDIPELQEDLGKLVGWLAQFPWLTPNQKLEYIGEEKSSEEGMDEIWVQNNLVKLSDANMPDVTAPLDDGMNDYNQATKPVKKTVPA